jgi:hypothetical protein
MQRAIRFASLSQNSFVSLELEAGEPTLLPDYDLRGECLPLVLGASAFAIKTCRKLFDRLLAIG